MDNLRNIDLTELEKLSHGDRSFIARMLESYCEQVPGLLDAFKTAVDKHDMPSVHALAHRMRPSFFYLGRNDISGLLEQLENMPEDVTKHALEKSAAELFRITAPVLEEAGKALHQLQS